MDQADIKPNENSAEQTSEIKQELPETQTQILKKKYEGKGFQSMSLAEYEAMMKRKNKKVRLKVPAHLKFILTTPFIIIFCFGLFYIPFLIYQAASGNSNNKKDTKKTVNASSRTF